MQQRESQELVCGTGEHTARWGMVSGYQTAPTELLKLQVRGWLCSVPPNGDMSTTRLSSAGASTSFVLQTLLCSSCHVDHLFFKTSFFPTLVNVLECFHHLRRKLASSGSGCICSVFPFRFSFFSGSPLFLLLHSLPNSSLSALLKEP